MWFVLGLIGLTLALHVAARLLYVSASARLFGQTPWLPSLARKPLSDGRSVQFYSSGGTRLEGTYLETTSLSRLGVIVCCHELNGDRWNVLPHAESLRQAGFDLLLFDFRNHGASAPAAGYQPSPWVCDSEVADVRAAVDYLSSRPGAEGELIGLFGLSKGGTAALCAAADDPRVRAVVVEGICPTERMQFHRARCLAARYGQWICGLIPRAEMLLEPLGAWMRMVIGWHRSCRFLNVERCVRRVRQPVLLIHGQCDPHVPLDLVRSLADLMSPCTKLWVVPRGKHTGASQVAAEEYADRTAWFFREHLTTDPAPRDATPQPAVDSHVVVAPLQKAAAF
jgi:pimeloyl-ACP methyl ester carboxylesterase